ncbi:MAG TPA: polyketide cyclase [Brevibacterium sp.]|nr:polyketide cyclase [Brevibacterium sp.]
MAHERRSGVGHDPAELGVGDEQLAAVGRSVKEREVEGRPAKVVVLQQTYATDVADLWDALTNAERIPRWFAPVSGELRLGGQYQIEGNANGTITACEPPRSFDATWEFGGGISWIEVRLTEVDPSHTRLQLSHIAYPDEHWKQYGPGAAGIGWDLGLLGLSLHLAGGTAPASEMMEWPASPEGLKFMTESGHAWFEADVAGGESAAVARASADRTIAFYTVAPGE